MFRTFMVGAVSATAFTLSAPAFAQQDQLGTAIEAKAMLEKPASPRCCKWNGARSYPVAGHGLLSLVSGVNVDVHALAQTERGDTKMRRRDRKRARRPVGVTRMRFRRWRAKG